MTHTEFIYLTTAEAQQRLVDNLHIDPTVFALKQRENPSKTAILATQLKYLQRSHVKLPTFYAAKAIIPPLAFEQCSSEIAASAKVFSGNKCLDLTCGLGVDTLHFSKCFQQVIAIEQNEVLAAVAQYNFELMKIHNIKIINTTAEAFIKHFVENQIKDTPETGNNFPFDLIYIDPARRNEQGKKIFLPEDCEPNIGVLMPLLKILGRTIMVKMSPLYDVDAALRQFPEVTKIGVLSIDNECKETYLIFENKTVENPSLELKIYTNNLFFIFENKIPFKHISNNNNVQNTDNTWIIDNEINYLSKKYIIEPNVAFYKARLLTAIPPQYKDDFEDNLAILTASNGFILSEKMIDKLPARTFKIIKTFEYQPKKLIPFLKTENITHIHIVQRNFPFSVADIRKKLHVKEGGDLFLICTLINDVKIVWLCEKVKALL